MRSRALPRADTARVASRPRRQQAKAAQVAVLVQQQFLLLVVVLQPLLAKELLRFDDPVGARVADLDLQALGAAMGKPITVWVLKTVSGERSKNGNSGSVQPTSPNPSTVPSSQQPGQRRPQRPTPCSTCSQAWRSYSSVTNRLCLLGTARRAVRAKRSSSGFSAAAHPVKSVKRGSMR